MGFFRNLVGKAADTAKNTMTDSLKEDLKTLAADLLPILISVGCVGAGAFILKRASVRTPVAPVPHYGVVSTVTNCYILDDNAKAEMLKKLLGGMPR